MDANPTFTGLTEQVFTATLMVTDANLLQDIDDALITVEVPDQRDLFNQTLTGTETYEACDTLIADSVTIASGSNITFQSLTVILGEDFLVEDGATFTVIATAPASCQP